MTGHMYILLCSNGSYYVGSTVDLPIRWQQHLTGEGANHTRRHPPTDILYSEEYPHVALAFKREHQVKKWRREKKEALIEGQFDELPALAIPYRDRKKLRKLIGD